MSEFIKNQYDVSKLSGTLNGEVVEFNCITNPSMTELQLFVDRVVGAIVSDDLYRPLLRDTMFDFFLISDFTDIDLSDFEENSDAIEIERFVKNNTISDEIKREWGQNIISMLNDALDACVAFKTGFDPHGVSYELKRLVNYINSYVNEVNIDDVKEFMNRFNQIGGDITPESVVESYIKSQSNITDTN